MSAIERCTANYVVAHAQWLCDPSSQYLSNALAVSQSSAIGFSQKIGFKGYPDLTYPMGETSARGGGIGAANGRDGVAQAARTLETHASASENSAAIKAAG